MKEIIANQIAKLINARNQLTKNYNSKEILKRKDDFVYVVDGETVLACAETKSVQWYQSEICHVSVAENAEGKGYGGRILELAEKQAMKQGARLFQCTIRANNGNSIHLFESKGYHRTSSFLNTKSGNWVHVYQKAVSVRQ